MIVGGYTFTEADLLRDAPPWWWSRQKRGAWADAKAMRARHRPPTRTGPARTDETRAAGDDALPLPVAYLTGVFYDPGPAVAASPPPPPSYSSPYSDGGSHSSSGSSDSGSSSSSDGGGGGGGGE